MAKQLAAVSLVFIAYCAFSSQVLAQIPDAVARQIGLETAWTAQIRLPVAERPIVSTQLWPSTEGAREYAQTEVPGRSIRVYADAIGNEGKPLGIEGAKQEARRRAARILGRFDGVEAKVISVPRIYLVVVTADGCVQNFDAETGEILWRAEAGFANAPTAPASVGKRGVALSHGGELRLFDWKTGANLKTIKLRTATAAGVALTSSFAFVPSLAGVVAVYSVGEKPLRPWQYTGHGLPVGTPVSCPTATPPLAALVTDRGHLYVFAEEERPQAWFRFETQSPFTGALTAAGNAFYVGDSIGNLFKISGTRLGQLNWRFTTGSPVSQNPLLIGNRVYALADSGYLFGIDDADGVAIWPEPVGEVKSVIGASKDMLYAKTSSMGMVRIDATTGKLTGQIGGSFVESIVPNQVSDRLYAISRNGQLQCLREIGTELPTMHVQPAPDKVEKPKPQIGAESQLESAAIEAASDPNAGTSDPFGAVEAPAATGTAPASATDPASDPFATPATPEASGAATADPFAATP